MNKLRAVIIDDEEDGVELLRLLLNRHIEDVKIVGETTSARSGVELITDFTPEIVFLDINMPEMNGFELLETLEWHNFNLVFTTAYQEHGLRALKKQAIDYLLKPIDTKELRLAVDKIKERIAMEGEAKSRFNYHLLNNIPQFHLNKLAIHSKNGVEYVDPLDIVSLESKSNYTLVTLISGHEILSPKTLKDFEQQLCETNANFMRLHHSFVVNLQKVSRYLKNQDLVVMSNDQKVPISKSRRDSFYKWLGIS